MSISVDNLDLRQIPFSRRMSRMMVLEGPAANGTSALYIAYTNSTVTGMTRYNLIQAEPFCNGSAVAYSYRANPGKLTISAEQGTIEFCFDGHELLQIRANGGLGLRFLLCFEPHEQFLDRLDGTVYAAFAGIGEFLFATVKGSQSHNGHWIAPAMKPDDTEIVWSPGQEGELVGYIRYAEYAVSRPQQLHDFDECVIKNLSDFNKWCAKYEKVPDRYHHVWLFSIYVVWICSLAPRGLICTNMVHMMRSGPITKAMGWQQSYHAMAAWQDINYAVELLYSMFSVQDEHGQLPDSVTEKHINMLVPKPPFQGFALNYIMSRAGSDVLSEGHCELLYQPMCKWVQWWLNFRDRDKDGLVGYVHGDESGWDDASVFAQGIPVETPDIAAFLILVMECCGVLAGKLGKAAESREWYRRSASMLEQMLQTFWNGEKFIATLDGSHEPVNQESIALYQPIILGKRLPQPVIDKLAEALGDSQRFYTDYGFVSESQGSPYYDLSAGAMMLGMVLAPVQLMITVGLYDAGKKELALRNAYNWCEQMLETGPQTIIWDMVKDVTFKDTGVPPVLPKPSAPGRFSSWGAAVFLVLCSLLQEEKPERSCS